MYEVRALPREPVPPVMRRDLLDRVKDMWINLPSVKLKVNREK